MFNIIGWLGQLCLGICAIPQAWASIRGGTSRGIDIWFLMLWFIGEILSLLYVIVEYSTAIPIICNYAINLIVVSIIVYFYIWPRERKNV